MTVLYILPQTLHCGSWERVQYAFSILPSPGNWKCNLEPHACWAGTLPLTHVLKLELLLLNMIISWCSSASWDAFSGWWSCCSAQPPIAAFSRLLPGPLRLVQADTWTVDSSTLTGSFLVLSQTDRLEWLSVCKEKAPIFASHWLVHWCPIIGPMTVVFWTLLLTLLSDSWSLQGKHSCLCVCKLHILPQFPRGKKLQATMREDLEKHHDCWSEDPRNCLFSCQPSH